MVLFAQTNRLIVKLFKPFREFGWRELLWNDLSEKRKYHVNGRSNVVVWSWIEHSNRFFHKIRFFVKCFCIQTKYYITNDIGYESWTDLRQIWEKMMVFFYCVRHKFLASPVKQTTISILILSEYCRFALEMKHRKSSFKYNICILIKLVLKLFKFVSLPFSRTHLLKLSHSARTRCDYWYTVPTVCMHFQ